jgi:uncharacterized protein YceH (UPF0502 family)
VEQNKAVPNMKNTWLDKRKNEAAHVLAQAIADRFRHLFVKEIADGHFLHEEMAAVEMELQTFVSDTERNIANLEHEMALLRAELDHAKKERWKFEAYLPTD